MRSQELLPEQQLNEDKSPPLKPQNSKYDMVLIIGPNNPKYEIEQIKFEARRYGLNICIIGDGKRFIPEREIRNELKGNIGPDTQINIWGHGIIKDQKHLIDIYEKTKDTSTAKLLTDLKKIYDADTTNKNTQMTMDVYSCFCGQAKTEIPKNVRATFHSGKKYATLISMSFSITIESIQIRAMEKTLKPYEAFMSYMLSPETLIWAERDSSGKLHNFKTAAPKKPLSSEKELRKYIISELKRFMKFREELGHCVKDIYGVDKLPSWPSRQKFINQYIDDLLELNSTKLKRYNELALIMECGRNSRTAALYIAKTSDTYCTNSININASLENGVTALHVAVDRSNDKMISELLKKGANLNKLDNNGFTPLYYAAYQGKKSVVKILLDGANGDIPAAYAFKAINIAKNVGHIYCAELIITTHIANIIFAKFNCKTSELKVLENFLKKTIFSNTDFTKNLIEQKDPNYAHAAQVICDALTKEVSLNHKTNEPEKILQLATDANILNAIKNATKTLTAAAPQTNVSAIKVYGDLEVKMPQQRPSFSQRLSTDRALQAAAVYR